MTNVKPKLRILIVDDNSADTIVLKEMLDRSGFKHDIITIFNHQEAIDVMINPDNIVKPFDLVIVDYWMNGKMGDELALELKEIDPGVEIIIYPSDTDPSLRQKFWDLDQLQAKGFFIKTNDEILSGVLYIMSNKIAGGEDYNIPLSKRIKTLQENVAKLKSEEGKYVKANKANSV